MLSIHEQNAMGRSPRLRLEAVGKCMGGPQATRVGVGGTLIVPKSAGDQLDAPGHLSARVDAHGIPVLIACDVRHAGDARTSTQVGSYSVVRSQDIVIKDQYTGARLFAGQRISKTKTARSAIGIAQLAKVAPFAGGRRSRAPPG